VPQVAHIIYKPDWLEYQQEYNGYSPTIIIMD
jgi:hypothetical protein